MQSHITLSYHTYAPAVIMINADRFADLSEEDQIAFRAAAKAGGRASRTFVRARDAKGLKTLKTSGITITDRAGFDRTAFEKALEPFYQEMAKVYTMEKIRAIKDVR